MSEQTPMVVVRMSSPAAERLAQLLTLAQDMLDAREQAHLLRTELLKHEAEGSESSRLIQALFTSAVITYCRAFAKGRVAGLSEQTFADLGPEALRTHRWFRKIRDQHIAHQVLPLEEIRVGVAIDESTEPPAFGIAHLHMKHQTTDVRGTESLIGLTEVLLNHLDQLIGVHQRIVLDEAAEMGVERLKELPPVEVTVQAIDLPDDPPR